MSAPRHSPYGSVADRKLAAKQRAADSLIVPSRAASDMIFGAHVDRDEPEFVHARNIIFLNKRFE